MNTQVGERYKCSDVNCACEIEVTKPSGMQNESFGSGSMNTGSLNDRSHTNQPIGGQAIGETGDSPTGVGSLRPAESATISTPGDFGCRAPLGKVSSAAREEINVLPPPDAWARPRAALSSPIRRPVRSDQVPPASKPDQLEKRISIVSADSRCKKPKPAAPRGCNS